MRLTLFLCGFVTCCALAQAPAYAQSAKSGDAYFESKNETTGETIRYMQSDVMIPMRDSIKLHTVIWRPAGSSEKLPIIMLRTPYGVDESSARRLFDAPTNQLAADHYIFAVQDLRGRFGSEGEFKMLRAPAKPGGTDESTDAYDTIDWLTKNLAANNGKVGMHGYSYGGWTAAMAAINPHPALKAISVQAAPEDMFMGDDFHHNGALRFAYTWEYTAELEGDGRTLKPYDFKGEDVYSWYLKQSDLATMDQRLLNGKRPTWQHVLNHPNFDSEWSALATTKRLPSKVAVPNLNVAGVFDQEDFYGPVAIYRQQEKGDTQNLNYFVMGPWNHGGWRRGTGRKLGPVDFGSDTGILYRRDIEAKWFRHWLKGTGSIDQPEAQVFQTGSNIWKSYTAWPPKENAKINLYFGSNGALSFAPPTAKAADHISYVSDPAAPVPYRVRPIADMATGSQGWSEWLVDDQRPFANRNDVAVWQTKALEDDVILAGEITAKLFAATTGSDADWVVKLIDVYPDDPKEGEMRGRQLMIANEVFRGRFLSSFIKPSAIKPNAITAYTINLLTASHQFKKGHRIMIQLQSSWFPLIDRNPQTFLPNIMKAKPADFRKATQSIYFSQRYPSAISLQLEK